MFDKIVLAVGNIDEMDQPVRIAIDMAKRYDATCHPIHVVDLPQNPSFPEYYERRSGKVDWDDVMRNIEDQGGEIVDDICENVEATAEELGHEMECLCRVGVGDPATTILNFSEDLDADLVIVGIHDREGLDRILHSSVSKKVVSDSKCPVLTVHV